MASLIAQVLLPLILGLIMLGIGLGLKPQQFRLVLEQPKAVVLGLSLQCLLLPLLALLIITILPLPLVVQAGLLLVALCPGGVTSNLFSYLAKGDVALSITLTSINSLLAPISLPLIFGAFIVSFDPHGLLFSGVVGENFSMVIIIKQLIAVTMLPILVGMGFAILWPQMAQRYLQQLNRLTSLGLLVIIIALVIANPQILNQLIGINAIAIILLIVLAMAIGLLFSRFFGVAARQERTLVLEVGVQNAGTAMFVAFTILELPELAVVPLSYGILMNIPAFCYLMLIRRSMPHKLCIGRVDGTEPR